MGKAIVIEGDFSDNNIGQVKFVEEPIPVTNISITNKSSLPATLQNKQTFQLAISLTPSDTTQRSVTYTSDNEAIATVSSSGLITAVGNGTATITVKSTINSSISDSIEVKAYKDVEAAWTLLLNPGAAEGVSGVTPFILDDKSEKTINLSLAASNRSNKIIYKSDGTQLAGAQQMTTDEVAAATGLTLSSFKANNTIPVGILDEFPYNSNNMLRARGIGGYGAYLNVYAGFGVSGLPAGSYRMRVWCSTSRDPNGKAYSVNCGILKSNGQALEFPSQINFVDFSNPIDFNISIGNDGIFTVTIENTDAFVNNYEFFIFNLIELTLLQ